MAVFFVKLFSRSLVLAFTDFSMLVAGTLFIWISIKYNFTKLIYSAGGEHRINLIFFKIGIFISSLTIILKAFTGSTTYSSASPSKDIDNTDDDNHRFFQLGFWEANIG